MLRSLFRIIILLNLFASGVTVAAQSPDAPKTQASAQAVPVAPDTDAGKQFALWLTAVNSGSRETIRQFVTDHYAPPPNTVLPVDRITDRQFGVYEATGGLTLLKAESSSSNSITAFLQAKRNGYCYAFTLFVSPEPPHKIVGSGLRSCEMPAELLPSQTLSQRQLAKNLDALLNRLAAQESFSGVILVAKDQRPIYQRAFGLASRAWNAPNRMDTRFNLASITKMFTAVAVAQLEEQGKLSYNDTVGKILPDYPNKEVAEKVTIHQLLTHTSGIVDSPEALDRALRSERPRPVSELLAPFQGDPLRFEPGARMQYSNLGYLLLGAIIEKASGQDYFTYVREHVFKACYELGVLKW